MQCAGEFPLLKTLNEQFGGKGLELLGVSVDAACDRARETVRAHGLSWPQVCDGKALKGEVARLYHADQTPAYFVVDRSGVIVGSKATAEQLRAVIEEALAAAPPRQ